MIDGRVVSTAGAAICPECGRPMTAVTYRGRGGVDPAICERCHLVKDRRARENRAAALEASALDASVGDAPPTAGDDWAVVRRSVRRHGLVARR